MDIEKSFIKSLIKNFKGPSFKVRFWDGEETLVGDSPAAFTLKLNEPLKMKDMTLSTTLAFGEAYMNKTFEIDGDLYFALNSILYNITHFNFDFKGLPKIFHKSSKSKQKENIASHYDIGNDFYSLWLDETLSYSCGYFKNENDSLYDAQMNKIHHILKKLNLKEGDTLLDIGCGWGALLIEATKKYKVKGVGITLSEEQVKKFNERINEEHLENFLEVNLMNYLDLEKLDKNFDAVVSVGMLEHVGRDHYPDFFKAVSSVLKDGGTFLLHYISSLIESPGDPWLKKYIFPGGVIPTLREIISLSAENNYHVLDVENLRLHYRNTLLYWYSNFNDNIEIINKKFDEKFIRMWQLYLCSCAAVFNNGICDLHQILLTKGINNSLPLTRDYMYKD
ncbi:cyclopropane-fatty-acyl-phospholipid synthase family protein [uncultured Clostridium sp.]|uniref:SAM-dependent methyltransferase n=1 Tax=uncultured Clostridium sp. TaxID=59620 RepID=UPI0025DB2426|nr:cyclopropane-fatty-acyl-phospholipid synthase family protein [uncultured Clostridium sp.]